MDEKTETEGARERIQAARVAFHDLLVAEAEGLDVGVREGWKLFVGLVHLADVPFDDVQAEVGVSWETYRRWREEDMAPRETVRRVIQPILVEMIRDARPTDATTVRSLERPY